MKLRFTSYLICLLFVVSFITCGGDSEDDADKQPAKPATSAGGGEVLQITVDYAAEEAAITEVMNLHAEAIGTKDADEFMPYWLRSESEDVFVAWDFWAGAFEKHLGWKAIKKGWEGIFRLRSGKMSVEIESIAIDKIGKNASLRGRYQWAVSGGLIASMKKDREEGWKIQQIDYTNEKFGKQVDELKDPAYVNPPPEDQ
jgi:ketosteroid isomerase-like protein